MSKKPDLNIPIIFQKINQYEVEDTRFMQVKIWLMHLEENFNSSYFEKEVVEKAIPSLSNTPILAYIEDNSDDEKDFSNHRMVLVKEEGQYKVKYIGQAIGVIPETNNAQFEMRVCDDGIEREFLTVDGLLWTKFDDPIDIMNRDKFKAESMELHDDYKGEYQDDGLFHFTEFKFYGACGLGKSVLPAMQNATIEAKFSFDGFQKEIQNKMEQFKQFTLQNQSSIQEVDDINFSKKEDEQVDEKLELLNKYNLTVENISFSIEELSLDEIENKIQEHFALLASGKQEEVINALKTEEYMDRWGDKYNRYSYVDHNDNEVFAYDRQDNWNLYGFTYSMSGDSVIIDFESKKRKKFQIIDFENDSSSLFELFPKEAIEYELLTKEKELTQEFNSQKDNIQSQLDSVTEEYEKAKPEFERLQKFEKDILLEQRQDAEEILFSQFDEKLKGIEEYEELKKTASNFELDTLEKECFVILGKKNANFAKQNIKKDKVKMTFTKTIDETDTYEELFNKYLKKD